MPHKTQHVSVGEEVDASCFLSFQIIDWADNYAIKQVRSDTISVMNLQSHREHELLLNGCEGQTTSD